MKTLTSLFWVGAWCWWLAAAGPGQVRADEHTFHSREAGFTITKPAAWQFLPVQSVAQNLAVARLKNKDAERFIRSKPNVPFLVIARFAEPYEGLNPSVQVSLKTQGELQGRGPVALLGAAAENLKRNFENLVFVREVTETQLDGQPAARLVAKYTVIDAKGTEFKTLAWMWVVPRGEYMLSINMYAPQEGPNTAEAEFEEILRSIKLAKTE